MNRHMEKAYEYLNRGFEPRFSTGLCGNLTAGFGKLDNYGYFQYPLVVNQDTQNIVVKLPSKVRFISIEGVLVYD